MIEPLEAGEGYAIRDAIRQLIPNQETVFDVERNLGEGTTKLTVGHRQLQPERPVEPEIARARARDHKFFDIEAFALYVKREGAVGVPEPRDSSSAVILADPDSKSIVAVLDESDDADREQIAFEAKRHPLVEPWMQLLQKPMPVLEFAVHCMKHRRSIVDPDGRELALAFSQIQVSKQVKMEQGIGKKSLNGVIVEIDINGTKKNEVVALPETIAIEVPLFIGGSPQRIEIDVLVDARGDNGAVVLCTAADLVAQEFESFEVFVQRVKEITGLLVGLGRVVHREWRLV